MDPREDQFADTQRKFAEFAERLTLEEARECEANIVGFLRLLTEWQSRAEGQTPSPNSGPAITGDLTAPPAHTDPLSSRAPTSQDAWKRRGDESIS